MNTINKNEDLFADFFQVGGYSNVVGGDIFNKELYTNLEKGVGEPQVDDSKDELTSENESVKSFVNTNTNTILAKDDAKEGKTFLYIGIIALALAVGSYFYFSKK
jgi:hypothetical protein